MSNHQIPRGYDCGPSQPDTDDPVITSPGFFLAERAGLFLSARLGACENPADVSGHPNPVPFGICLHLPRFVPYTVTSVSPLLLVPAAVWDLEPRNFSDALRRWFPVVPNVSLSFHTRRLR